MLVVEGLSVWVGGRELLRGVSFSAARGEAVYILGPNGVGKSSLLKALMGIPGYEAPEGRVLLDCEDLSRLRPHERAARGLALAFQTPPRLQGVRVGALLGNICRKWGCDVREVARAVEVEHLLEREVGRLSGGEGKRVELATVLARRPKAALVDEPDSGVDVDSLQVVARALRKLAEEAALVVVTHGAHIARHLPPDKVCVLYGGGLRRCGGRELAEEVLAHGFAGVA
ncbi:ATP-binding cassette domain-containing protein [Pyrobaculum neutrophilum]|uniref:ABC transporter related n=1 Tax=Pyrobaculum neutrophilum (strain DSM 2338 / JCM 9278 / NBRC 100436 / V24Sta) TaxID=444157 RepID=B1YDM4_PYRNV|nr:ATP-binding cassette domain-containing protein [Pyrobaculum neutrophilum]ACB39887.1 ABC transporter related [Pyrobaculum neutrophilum V24Sta]